MNTPHLDGLFAEVADLRDAADSLRAENEKLRRELAHKNASWDMAMAVRDGAAKQRAQRLTEIANGDLVQERNDLRTALSNLLDMCEAAHQQGCFPWEFDTKAAGEARHALHKP